MTIFPTDASFIFASSNFSLNSLSKIYITLLFSIHKLFSFAVQTPIQIPTILYFSIYLNIFSYFCDNSVTFYVTSVSYISSKAIIFFNTTEPEEPIYY